MYPTTAVVFDPLISYYRLPVTDTVLCFVNLYFDLMELERQALEEDIQQSDQSIETIEQLYEACLLYTSPSPRDRTRSRMPSSA